MGSLSDRPSWGTDSYREQLRAGFDEVELDFWNRPVGVEIPGDTLRFLYVTDAAEQRIIYSVCQEVDRYQRDNLGTDKAITRVVMVTMGGLLTGAYAHDYLAWTPGFEDVMFDVIGVKLYKGPGERLKEPLVVRELSCPVEGEVVMVLDDLGDFGETSNFVEETLRQKGARDVLHFLPYLKPAAKQLLEGKSVFTFGEVPQNTWVITPRERWETLVKRVGFWRDKLGVSPGQCREWLKEIGYPDHMIEAYLSKAFYCMGV